MANESSFSFDRPASPKSADYRNADKSSTLFTFDNVGCGSKPSAGGHKSFKTRTSVDMSNKENFRSDIFKIHTSSSSSSNNSSYNNNNNARNKSENNNSNRKERRSFKCERLSNIFSHRDSSVSASSFHKEKEKSSGESSSNSTKSRKINSAPVYRKHMTSAGAASAAAQSKFDDEELSASANNNATDMTMFPFDREAIDYERIQRECFAVEEEDNADDRYINARKAFPYEYDDDDTEDSPSYEMLDQKIAPLEGIFQQYAAISQHEKERQSKKRAQSPTETGKNPFSKIEHINRKLNETSALIHEQPANSNPLTSPIPDLKIDFFAEQPSLMASSFSRENENVKCDILDECQQLNTTSSFGSKNTMSNNNVNSNINGSINLTSNPMSTAVCTPRATIVVQQVCFSP